MAILNGSFLLLAIVGYVILLLKLAQQADEQGRRGRGRRARAFSYALSLSVLCTSWTYFGAAGIAMRDGWNYLPMFLGGIFAVTFLGPIWRRIAVASRRENISSVADFLASRYGKSRALGATIACVAIIGALPYIALQLLSLSHALALVVGGKDVSSFVTPMLFVVFALLAILFGARRPTLTQHNRGLTRIVTIEAIVKLTALVVVAIIAVTVILDNPAPAAVAMTKFTKFPGFSPSFIVLTILCTITMFTLPRTFHLGFVTLESTDDIATSRWLFPSYMALWAVAIIPIAIAGSIGPSGDPDLTIVRLPLLHGGPIFAGFAYIGGFSAGAAMVMVETIALSAMVSNELILPLLARTGWSQRPARDVGSAIVNVRRVSIVVILGLAYLYFIRLNGTDLSQLGFTSLAASAQLFPALVGGVLWRRGHARGALWGIGCGMAVWLVALAAPQLNMVDSYVLTSGLLSIGVVVSLSINVAMYVGISMLTTPRLIDHIQANAFVEDSPATQDRGRAVMGTVGELRELLQRFLGSADTARGLLDFARDRGRVLGDPEPVTPAVARAAERMLAGAIGASSARNVIALALATEDRKAADVGHILDEAANAIQFSREIVHAALDNLDQGVSVVDSDLRLVAWNHRYLELLGYSPADIYIGRPMEELIRSSSERADIPAEEIEQLIEDRLGAIKRTEPQAYERQWPNGMILKVVGKPLTTGEYVTSFSDVTELRAASKALGRMNEELEDRVDERTSQLTEANQALAQANAVANRLTTAQNRFVAAASHDLMQPLHAARLLLGAAETTLDRQSKAHQLLARADMSIEAADRLLKALLNLSKIEVAGLLPDVMPVDLGQLLDQLEREFRPVAKEAGLELRIHRTSTWALSSSDLLRSVLQNLLSNAIRYTPTGRVFLGVRRVGADLRIEVRDSGSGIAEEAQALIFKEYIRLPSDERVRRGSGLGLAIAERICNALDHKLAVSSRLGRGSVFSVTVPLSKTAPQASVARITAESIEDLRVLCVEDEDNVRFAQQALFDQWGIAATCVRTAEEAEELPGEFDLVVADYHLGPGATGLDLLTSMKDRTKICALLTANDSEAIREAADRLGVTLLRKPLAPAKLRALLAHARQVAATPSE